MCLRFWPEWSAAKAAVASGSYGRVLSARFRRVAQAPGWGHGHFLNAADSGGALLDLHIHDVDFIRFCFGHPSRVFSRGHTRVSGGIDHVVSQYDTAGGAVISAEGSWAMTPGFGFCMAYTVVFERATLDYDSSRGTEALRRFVAESARHRWVFSGDIRLYFPSIDLTILRQQLAACIACPGTLWLLDRILANGAQHGPALDAFPGDTLLTPLQRPRGLPIGNLTNITDAERALIAAWFTQGAKVE